MTKRFLSAIIAVMIVFASLTTTVFAGNAVSNPDGTYSQDFEDIAVGTSGSALAEESGLTFGGNGTVSVISDNGTNKLLLEGGGPAMDVYNVVEYTLPQEITKGVIETSLKASFDVYSGVQAFLAVLNGSADKPMISTLSGDWTYYTNQLTGINNQSEPTINTASGMYHLRTVVYRENETDDWTAELYDDGGDEPKLMYSTTISSSTHSKITGIRLANNWPLATVQNVMIDDIKMDYYLPSDKFTGFSQDFENTTVEESGLTFGGNGIRSIVTDSGTNKLLLEGGGPAMDVYNVVEYTFPQEIKTGVIETSLKAGFDVYSGIQAFLAVLNGSADKPMISTLSGDWTYYTNQLTGINNQSAPTINTASGMYHLRTVVYRENETDDWTAELYDDGGDDSKLMYSTTISASTHSKITGIRLANNWPMASVQNVMIDDIEVKYFETLEDIGPSEPEPDPEPDPEPEPEPEQPVEFADYSQDFESDTVDKSGLTFGGNGTVSVVSNNGTNKLLLEGGTPPDKYNEVDYKFPEAVTQGIIETSIKVSFDDIYAGAHAFLGVLSGTTNRGIISAYANWTYYTTEAGEGGKPAPTLNSTTNMYHLRTVVYRNSTSDNWTAELYDDGGKEPMLMYTTEISKSTHPRITGIRLANTWPLASVQRVMIDDILIKYTGIPYAESSDCDDCEPTIDNIVLKFSTELQSNDFELKMMKKDDSEIVIDTSFVYDEVSNSVTVKLGSFLDYDTEYIIEFDKVQIQKFSFKTKKAPITVTKLDCLYGLENGVTTPYQPDGVFSAVCDVTLERNTNTSDVLLVLVVYDEKGAISKIGTNTISGSLSEGKVTIDNLTAKSVNEMRAYVWEQNETGLHQVNYNIID